jgi:serine phosphatase RsbU (regulator of sigma subunit)
MLLDSIASQCAVALERARLMSETRRVAESLQAGLAPHDVPTVAGLDLGACYQAGGDQAEAIGGDWYDVLPQSDGTVVLVVGDVMGRGVDAAAAMTRIRSAIRAFASVDPSPDVVLSKADTFLANEFPDDFVTVLYLLLDPVTGNLRMVSAGHLPALRLAPDTEPAFLEIEDSPPVGLAGAPRVVRDDQLPRGASLLLTTDGLVERPGEDLKEALRATGITARQLLAGDLSATAVAEHLVERAGPAERADDITVLIVRRT